MTNETKADAIALAVFTVVIVAFAIYGLLIAITEHLPPVEDNRCPDSHNVIINGVWEDCTGDSTHYRGYVYQEKAK